jgi:Protein of unknown function (DUF2905)
MSRWLVIAGFILILIGVAWPWLSRMGLGYLPGDIHFERKGFSFHFPVTSSIIVSLALSLLLWIFRK